MTKGEAVLVLLHEQRFANRNARASTASVKRILRACKAFDFDDTEIHAVMRYMQGDTVEPYWPTVQRMWS